MDDLYIIVWNPLVHTIQGVWRGFAGPYWPPDLGGQMYRPLPLASFAMAWTIAGAHPVLFHAMNLLWHAAVAVSVAARARRLAAATGAVVAGVFFFLHSVQVEAVGNGIRPREVIDTAGGRPCGCAL